MSPLRVRMIEDMKLAGLAATTQEIYLQAVRFWRSITIGRRRCWPRKRCGDICWMFVSGMRAAASRPAITASSSSTGTR